MNDERRRRLAAPRRPLHARHFAAAALALLALLACGVTTLAKAPAARVRLFVTVSGQYGEDDRVFVGVSLDFRPTRGQHVTCNGVALIPSPRGDGSAVGASIDRVPSGGSYTFVYSDERGQKTTFALAVPAGRLAVTDPGPGAALPILHPPASAVIKTPVPRLTVRYDLPTLPPQTEHPAVWVDGVAYCGDPPGTCGQVRGQPGITENTYIFLALDSIDPKITFASFVPGPGKLELTTDMQWRPPAPGFESADVKFHDKLTVPVTWVAVPAGE